jgi:tetratricopeptide (TPR) repeat protein
MKKTWWAAIPLVAALGLLPLSRKNHPPTAPSSSHAVTRNVARAPDLPAAGYDPAPFGRRTTDGNIARDNLTARIDAMTGLLKRDPDAAGLRKSLVEALLSRTQFFGTFSDFDRARALVTPPSPRSTAAELDEWAQVAGALHDFRSARGALDAAEKRDGVARAAQRSTLALALGEDLPAVYAAREAAARKVPTFETLAGLAAAEAALGRFEDADATYRRALDAYRDVSAFPVAWVEFQRGMMWAESAGRPERAVPLYRDAIARLPGYVVANVHLSELEAEMGDRESAIRRLAPLADTVNDPEPAAVLAKLLADSNPAQSKRLAEKARRGYEALLTKHRNAFLDHAAEFFGGAGGDPRRALALAEENLQLRPTDRAYALAIRMATAAHAGARACALVQEAGETRASAVLAALVRETSQRCPTSGS